MMDWTPLQSVIGFFMIVFVYQTLKRIFLWGLTYNYKHDEESLKASKEFFKFGK